MEKFGKTAVFPGGFGRIGVYRVSRRSDFARKCDEGESPPIRS